ncbi:MAG TPA: TlpA disulfide reductase family protein [Xanthobacteraceae bacterium]|jgi:thiol-disulfide isomerase/thioredoxin|nr:TlpA disulfide reductase family protein [Xanthobacteraceae bacterium]
MTIQPDAARRAPRRIAWIAVAALAGAAAGLAAVYGIGRFGRNAGEAACRPGVETARRIAPLARGEVAAVSTLEEPRRAPDLAFKDAAGATKTLADWRGRAVLFNLWATWCVPCRKEMPALDALQARLGGPRFDVVAVNIDTRDPDKPKAWLKEVGINRLAYYADPSAKAFQDLKLGGQAFGMPTTLLIDAGGCEVGTLAGSAEWASDDALKLINALVGS